MTLSMSKAAASQTATHIMAHCESHMAELAEAKTCASSALLCVSWSLLRASRPRRPQHEPGSPKAVRPHAVYVLKDTNGLRYRPRMNPGVTTTAAMPLPAVLLPARPTRVHLFPKQQDMAIIMTIRSWVGLSIHGLQRIATKLEITSPICASGSYRRLGLIATISRGQSLTCPRKLV